jgi:hypothetical protein
VLASWLVGETSRANDRVGASTVAQRLLPSKLHSSLGKFNCVYFYSPPQVCPFRKLKYLRVTASLGLVTWPPNQSHILIRLRDTLKKKTLRGPGLRQALLLVSLDEEQGHLGNAKIQHTRRNTPKLAFRILAAFAAPSIPNRTLESRRMDCRSSYAGFSGPKRLKNYKDRFGFALCKVVINSESTDATVNQMRH